MLRSLNCIIKMLAEIEAARRTRGIHDVNQTRPEQPQMKPFTHIIRITGYMLPRSLSLLLHSLSCLSCSAQPPSFPALTHFHRNRCDALYVAHQTNPEGT